jgi:hypothetical protein
MGHTVSIEANNTEANNMNGNQVLAQVAYAQKSIAESVSRGYTANQAAQMHLDSLRFISVIKTMNTAVTIVNMAARLNGLTLNWK